MSGTEAAILSRLGPSRRNVEYAIRVDAIHNSSVVLLVLLASFPRLLNVERVYLEMANRKPLGHVYSITECLREVLKANLVLEFIHVSVR